MREVVPLDGGRTKAPRPTGVFLVDDHPVVREGLRRLIAAEPDLVVVGEAEDTRSARRAIERDRPAVVILDLSLRDTAGIAFLSELRQRAPESAILVVSAHDEALYAERVLQAGARGYVMKDRAGAEIVAAIRQVVAGHIAVSAAISQRVLGKMGVGASSDTLRPMDCLTNRELQVFELCGKGLDRNESAAALHISVKTVDAHRQSIKRKLGLADATELLRHAILWAERGPRGG